MSTFDLKNPSPIPGDQLRDEVANLLSMRYGRPEVEVRTGGKKTDIYFRQVDFGKDVRIFVEVKDYSRTLTRQQVNSIWTDYEGLVRSSQPASLLLVTRTGLTADAQFYVAHAHPEMRHLTIWELENDVLGMTQYTRSLVDEFKRDGLNQYYVQSRASAASYSSDEQRMTTSDNIEIFPRILEWIDDETRLPVAVLGGYGAGKTSLVRRLVSHQATMALSDPHARRPVLINLGAFSRYSSLEGILGGLFTHEFPIPGFNVHYFLAMNDKGRLLVVLDGFDEMKHAMSWVDFHSQIAALNRLTAGNAKLVMLGRPSAFLSNNEHIYVLRGKRRHDAGWRRLPGWPEFREFDLQPFSPAERTKFIGRYLYYLMDRSLHSHSDSSPNSKVEHQAYETNRVAENDPDMFGKPVHAKILTDLASDMSVDLSPFVEGVSRWELYKTFFVTLADREVNKEARRPIGSDRRLRFLRELAFWLWTERGGSTSFAAIEVPDLLIRSMLNGEQTDLESQRRELLSGAFLENKSGEVYFFPHRSFAEFLVAERMHTVTPSSSEHGLYSRLLHGNIAAFLREAPDKQAIQRWAETLPQAIGRIRLEYLRFIATAWGGLEHLVRALPEGCVWQKVLRPFGRKFEFDA